MGKKIYLTILYIITIFCIGFGIFYHFYGNFTNWNTGNEKQVKIDKKELSAFENLDLDLDTADITLKQEGTTYTISYAFQNKTEPTISNKDGLLKIKQKTKKLGFFKNMKHKKKAQITITVPTNATFSSLVLSNDVGSVKIDSIQAQTMKLTGSVGNLDIKNCSGKDFTCENDVGDSKINNCSFTNMKVIGDTGNIKLESCVFSTLNGSNDVGDIKATKCEKLTDYKIDLTTDLGSIRVGKKKQGTSYHSTGSTQKSIILKTDLGDIKLE